MATESSGRRAVRRRAAGALEARCPRCAAGRGRSQRYCLECGLALPRLDGPLAALRRRWLKRLGWYPGDFVWVALALALLAGGAAAAAIVFDRSHLEAGPYLAPTLGLTAPVHGAAGANDWPAGYGGWTVVLASLPTRGGVKAAERLGTRARAAGLPEVGVLDSSDFASLLPGYFVVFSGVYGAVGDAQIALRSVLARGYPGAYPTKIVP